jgi:hypothetical protein
MHGEGMSRWEILILVLVVLVLIVTTTGLITLWGAITGRFPAFYRLLGRLPLYSRAAIFSEFGHPLLYEIIVSAEREYRVTLSAGARQMLVIPVLETIETGEEFEWEEVRRSIFKIVQTTAEGGGPREGRSIGERFRNSLAIIRAFSAQYCRIPPFCGPPG